MHGPTIISSRPYRFGFSCAPCVLRNLSPSVMAARIGGMPLVFGMTLFAGVVEAAVGIALWQLRFVITLVLSGLTVFVVGLELGVVGLVKRSM